MQTATTARAIVRDRYGSPDVLRLDDIDLTPPGEGEVAVEMRVASVNTADLDTLRGWPPAARVYTGLTRPRLRVPGLDVVGQVVATGPGVSRVVLGDEVWADLSGGGHGAFAERVLAPEKVLHRLPPDLDPEIAATIPHSGLLALQALRAVGPIARGSQVLINGAAGCVGPFAIQLAQAWGAEVTAVDHHDKHDLLRQLEVDHLVDHTTQDVTRSGRRYDVVLDIAATRTVLAFRRLLAPGGRYVQIARSLGGFLHAAVVGAAVSRPGRRRMGVFGWRPGDAADLRTMADHVRRGSVRPIIDRRYSLEQVPDALRRLAAGDARGKLLVVP